VAHEQLSPSRTFRGGRTRFAVVLALATCAVGASIWRDRSLAVESGVQDAHNIATLLGEQIAGSIQTVDAVLRGLQAHIRDHIGSDTPGSIAASPAFHGMLMRARASLPEEFQIGVADERGDVVASTLAWPTPALNVADRDYFNELAANDDDRLAISLPVVNRGTREPAIVLARRITGPYRAFLGVVLITVKPGYFEQHYGAVYALSDQVFSLLRRDGTFIIRYPEAHGAGATIPPDSPFHALVRAGGGSYRSTGVFGRANRWVAVVPLKRYPLVANISVPEAALLAGWRVRTAISVVVAGVFLGCAIALLSILMRQMRRLGESELELRAYRDRTAAELDAARRMQASLLPSAEHRREIGKRTGLDIASRFATCTELGGDLWGIHDFEDGRIGVYIADFTGHGTGPAVNTFRLHTLINEMTSLLHDPARLLAALNRRLAEYLTPGEFATMFYGIIDLTVGRMTYAAAGSPPPIVRNGKDMPLVAVDSSGIPLGIVADAEYACADTPFDSGAMLFLYSDVFTDLLHARERPVGKDGALELALECAQAETAETFVGRICALFLDRLSGALDDDLTAVCVARP